MKFKRFVSLLCVLFIAFSVCSAATVFAEASAVAFKGTRVLELESDPSDMDNYINGGRAAFDLMLRKNAPEWLKFSVNSVLAGDKIETTVKEKALVTYVQQDWTEGAAVLLAAGRKKEGGKKARYEFE